MSLLCQHTGIVGSSFDATTKSILVSVRGDGVLTYGLANQRRLQSLPLGSPHFELQTAACGHARQLAVVLRDTNTGKETMISVPQGDESVKTLASAPSRVNVPSASHSCHVLAHPAVSSKTAVPVVAVVLQGGKVGYMSPDSFDLRIVPAPETQSTSGKSLNTATLAASRNASLVVATQQAHGSSVQVVAYLLASSSSGSLPAPMLAASCSVPCPAHGAMLTHITLSASYALLQWSSGTATVVRGLMAGSSPQSSPQPTHFTVTSKSDGNGASTSAPTPPPASGRKRKGPPAANGAVAHARFLCSAVDDGQFVVLNLDSAQGQMQLGYTLFDSHFGCPVSSGSIELEAPLLVPDTTRCTAQFAGMAQNVVILQTEGAAYSLPLQTQPVSLLSLVAKLAVTAHQPEASQAAGGAAASAKALAAPPQPVSLAPALVTASPAAPRSMADLLAAEGDDEEAVVLQPVPQAHVTRHTNISAEIIAQINSVPSGKPAPKQALDSAVAYISGCKQQGLPVTQLLPTLTANRLAEAGSWKQLESLLSVLEHGSLPGCDGLLHACADAQQYSLLPLVATRLDDAGPAAVVQALRVLLAPMRLSNKQARTKAHGRLRSMVDALVSAAEASPSRHALALAQCASAAVRGWTVSQVLLHPLVAMPIDTVGVQAALRVLDAPEVEALLAYLHQWMHVYEKKLGDLAATAVLPEELLFPTHAQVLEWVRVLIDAHLARLMMASRSTASGRILTRLLSQLLHRIKAQTKSTQDLASLQGAAQHMLAQAPLPSSHVAVATAYTAEVLDLRVWHRHTSHAAATEAQ